MTDTQYQAITGTLAQIQGAIIGLSNRVDAHIAQSKKEHQEIIDCISELAQTISDHSVETEAKNNRRFIKQGGRIRLLERHVFQN